MLLVVTFIFYLLFSGALCGDLFLTMLLCSFLEVTVVLISQSVWLLVSDSIGKVDVTYSAAWLFCRGFSIDRTF